MSYRNAWGYLRELEKAAGFKFVERAPGGSPRAGMRLTDRGEKFLARYGTFQRGLERAAARQFARVFAERAVSARRTTPAASATRARSARASSAAR
jgi:molybdate transport repressor ModE-like protein